MKSLRVNGIMIEAAAVDLPSLFDELGLPASLLLVEYNGKALVRSEWDSIKLSHGDHLELLSVAAGG